MLSFNLRVVLCRIRLFPTLISKIKWLVSELPLNKYINNSFFSPIMDDGPPKKIDTLGISFWFCNTALWFLIYLCMTYKIQTKYLLQKDSRMGRWFRSANTANQINGNSLTASTIHAVLTTLFAVYIVFIDEK